MDERDAGDGNAYPVSLTMGPAQKKLTVVMWILAAGSVAGAITFQQYRNAAAPPVPTTPQIEIVVIDPTTAPTTGPVNFERMAAAYEAPVDIEMPAPAFDLVDQSGTPFKSDQLKGKVWTAMLFFSNCPGVCPGMKGRIVALQKQVTDDRVHFVSFSVDPERDTPAKLAEYHKETDDLTDRWHMLTGTVDQMHAVAAGIGLPYDQPANHSARILLVDQQGVIRRVYASSDNAHMKQLAEDAKRLAEKGKL